MISERFKGGAWLRLVQQLLVLIFDEDKEYELTIKEYRKRRSKDANAYFWEFLDKLAVKLRIGKTELYRELIRDIGGNSTTVCVKEEAADALVKHWEHNGLGWVADVMNSKIDGCKNVILYTGSSEYDTAQMSRLIDRLIWECNIVGIDTTDLRTKALLEVQNG